MFRRIRPVGCAHGPYAPRDAPGEHAAAAGGTALLQLRAAGTCTALLFMRTSGAASAASDTAAAAADDDDERRRRRRHKHTHTTCMARRFRCVTPNHRFDDGGGGFDADRLAHEDALECGIISVQ